MSGNITLNPGVYIFRGVTIKPGGNGSLTGQGVTLFLMEGSQITINANEQVNLSPPTSGPYAGITIFENRGNTSALTLNGGANSVISGFVYAPDAAVSFAGNSDMSGQGGLSEACWLDRADDGKLIHQNRLLGRVWKSRNVCQPDDHACQMSG
ncbi:hypothetical protein [Mesorhizobium huakuii]|uniref:hypothetical protein n=1 Tax=Mesorhizobium huakuii TaxID=28104 RepID=UPI001FD40093|nr:hypothetical protein [Mesorhizobium huakuii]